LNIITGEASFSQQTACDNYRQPASVCVIDFNRMRASSARMPLCRVQTFKSHGKNVYHAATFGKHRILNTRIASEGQPHTEVRATAQLASRLVGRARAIGVTMLAVVIVLFASARTALADPRTPRLVESLRSDDYRVRTSAALALGGTSDEGAVVPLCGVLSDSTEVVRQAAAAALKRLAKPAALGCLRTQLAREQSDAVKSQLNRAIEAIASAAPPPVASAGTPAAAAPNAAAKYYVALSAVTNRTSRPQAEIEAVVLRALRAKMDALGTFEVAPAREADSVAKATITRRHLKGLYLAISVDPLKYDSATTATVKVAVFSYPNKDLRAEVPGRGVVSGGAKGDPAAENAAMEFAAAKAVELIAKNADSF
jgi:HEAT repeats